MVKQPKEPRNKQSKILNDLKTQEDQDLRKIFEHVHHLKREIDDKIQGNLFVESIMLINKCISLAKKFYQEDHSMILELMFKQSECYVNVHNLDEAIVSLDSILNISNSCKDQQTIGNLRYKAHMLLGATCINLANYTKALKAYNSVEKEIPDIFNEPELNLKLSAVKLNIGICYIYLNNFSIAERYFINGQLQIDGLLGNEVIYRLNADFHENLGLVNEHKGRFKEAVNLYKKSLKIKFGYYGENHDDVLDLQYKISSALLSLKQYKEAEEILLSMTDVVTKEKINNCAIEMYYRYGAYFYMTGIVLIKLMKKDLAKTYLNEAEAMWKDILNQSDPALSSLRNLIKICDKK